MLSQISAKSTSITFLRSKIEVFSICVFDERMPESRLQKLRTENARLSKEIKEKEDDNIILRKQIRDLKLSIAETQRNHDAIAKVSQSQKTFLSNTFLYFPYLIVCLKPFMCREQARPRNKE